jgi:hypothetical protein
MESQRNLTPIELPLIEVNPGSYQIDMNQKYALHDYASRPHIEPVPIGAFA